MPPVSPPARTHHPTRHLRRLSLQLRGAPRPTRLFCPRPIPPSTHIPPTSECTSKSESLAAFSLFLYFFLNLSLTLFNKSVLFRFPFPYTLTAVHALSAAVGTYTLRYRKIFIPARVTRRQNATLVAFSLLYTLNIAVSNVSLQMVTVSFHQVVRSTTPLFTLLLSIYLLGTVCSLKKILSLFPVVIGVTLATYGEYHFTALGCLLTVLGMTLAAAKTVFTNILQSTPPKSPTISDTRPFLSKLGSYRLSTTLHPLDLLMHMSPLAFVQCLVYAYSSGELHRLAASYETQLSPMRILALAMNGMLAFALNIASFTANKRMGPLTMTVAGNVKQVLTILLAVVMFGEMLSLLNFFGILLTMGGGLWYGLVEIENRSLRDRGHNQLLPRPSISVTRTGRNGRRIGWMRRVVFLGSAKSGSGTKEGLYSFKLPLHVEKVDDHHM